MNSDLYLLLTFCNYKNSGWEMLSQSTELSKGKSGVKPRSILLQSLHVLTTMIHYSGRVVFALYYLFFFFFTVLISLQISLRKCWELSMPATGRALEIPRAKKPTQLKTFSQQSVTWICWLSESLDQ